MADSEISVKVSAETAQAVTNLRQVGQQTEELGKKTVQSASASTGAILQLGGSVMSLKSGLSSLAQGRGGIGALLQVGGAGLSAKNALKGLGAAGTAAGGATAAAFALAAAAVVGIGAEVAKSTMGTEQWAKRSTDAIEGVTSWFGRAKTAWGEFLSATAAGSTRTEYLRRETQASMFAVIGEVEAQIKLNSLTGEALKNAVRQAEAEGDVVKFADLYAKMRKEAVEQAKKEKEELIETQNILQKNSAEQAAANKEGASIERKEGAFNTAREIAKDQKVDPAQAQRLDKMADLIGPAIGARIETALTRADPGRESIKQIADPNAKRQLDNQIVNLAKSGVAMETLVTTLTDNGMDQEAVVSTLQNLEKRLPAGFGDELLKHIKPGVIVWQ